MKDFFGITTFPKEEIIQMVASILKAGAEKISTAMWKQLLFVAATGIHHLLKQPFPQARCQGPAMAYPTPSITLVIFTFIPSGYMFCVIYLWMFTNRVELKID